MRQDSWKRIQEVFLEAVELPEGERAAYLDHSCVDDGELRAEVESLLRADCSRELSLAETVRTAAQSLLRQIGGRRPD